MWDPAAPSKVKFSAKRPFDIDFLLAESHMEFERENQLCENEKLKRAETRIFRLSSRKGLWKPWTLIKKFEAKVCSQVSNSGVGTANIYTYHLQKLWK